jgi:hypothetical protein
MTKQKVRVDTIENSAKDEKMRSSKKRHPKRNKLWRCELAKDMNAVPDKLSKMEICQR